MSEVRAHDNDALRRAELDRLDVLKRRRSEALDLLAAEAREAFGASISVVTLVGEDWQYFVARAGTEADGSPRQDAFCAHAVTCEAPLAVADAQADPRFARNPLVTGGSHVRSYLGGQIRVGDGVAVGTVCVLDTQPRRWTDAEIARISRLAAIAARIIETERAAADASAARAEREELYLATKRDSAAISAMTDGVVVQDRSGMIVSCNKAAESILGLSADQIMGRTSYDPRWRAIREDGSDYPGEEHPITLALRTGRSQRNMRMGIHKPDGQLSWINVNAEPVFDEGDPLPRYSVCTFSDETQVRQSLARLESLKRRLDVAMASAGAGLWELDLPSRRLWASESMARYFDPEGLETVAGQLADLIETGDSALFTTMPGPEADQVRRDWTAHLGGGPGVEFEHELTVPDGGRMHVRSQVVAKLDASGKVTGAIGLITDISDLKLKEAQLSTALAAAEQASRAKADFIAMMSHELRTPMNGVLGCAALLKRSDIDTRQEQWVDTITSSGRTLVSLLDDLLDLSSIEAGKVELRPAAVDPSAAIDDVLDLYRAQADGKGLGLRFTHDWDRGRLARLDPERFKQIVSNLVSNGVKYTDAGGVAVSLVTDDHARRLILTVSDTGPGVAEADQASIFDAFERGAQAHGDRHSGTGLGLSICRKLARAMGGDVRVQSVEGQGARFTVQLPLHYQSGDQPAHAASGATLAGLQVLCVDDVAANRMVLCDMVESFGAHAASCASAAEALDVLADRPFDLVLLDILMPDMRGDEIAARLRGGDGPNATTPLVAVTANVLPEQVALYQAAGFDAVISKPVDMTMLEAAMARAHHR